MVIVLYERTYMNLGETANTILGWLEGVKTYATVGAIGGLAILSNWGLNVPTWVFYVLIALAVVFLKAGQNRIEAGLDEIE